MIDRLTQIGTEIAELEKEEAVIKEDLFDLEDQLGITEETTNDEYEEIMRGNEKYKKINAKLNDIENRLSYLEEEQVSIEEEMDYGSW